VFRSGGGNSLAAWVSSEQEAVLQAAQISLKQHVEVFARGEALR